MTQTRRIILNVLATYGRSLFSLVCGLFTGRWVLEALGTTSYGVFGVVGTIIGLVTVVNQMLSSSVSRYFAYSVGQTQASSNVAEAIEDSRRWFNSAVAIHFIIPSFLVAIGWPLGAWAINNYFNIPDALRGTSVWVLSFSMITTYVAMVSVPFQALYTAHQYIAELTIYSVFQTAANVVFARVLLSYQDDRLWFNAFYLMLIAVIPQVIIAGRAFVVFPECRIKLAYMRDKSRYRQLFSFAGWQIVGWLGLTLRFQGLTTLCNKVLGLEYNSSLNVSNTVSQHTMSFSYALNSAFVPAITNAAGAGDRELYESLTLRSCKFGAIMCAIFIVPLCLEMHYVMHLWLKVVPPMVEPLCALTLASLIVERSTAGYTSAIYANGRIKWPEIVGCINWTLSFVLGFIFVCVYNCGIMGIATAIFVCMVLSSLTKLAFAKYLLKMRVRPWFSSFAIPFSATLAASWGIGLLPSVFLEEGFIRLFLTVITSCVAFSLLSFFFVCDESERKYVINRFSRNITTLTKR